MNALLEPEVHTELGARLRALARLGLAEFAAGHLERPSGVFAALRAEAQSYSSADASQEWTPVCAQFERDWPPRGGALARLVGDFDLGLPEAFLLALAGEVETSHLVDLAVAELQAPAKSARPSLHLCAALLGALFPAWPPTLDWLQDSSLVQGHVLEIEGEVPLPLRTLRIHPLLWSVLLGRTVRWPGSVAVQSPLAPVFAHAVMGELPTLASILEHGEMDGLIVRGTPGSGRAQLVAELAPLLGLEAIEVPLQSWEQDATLVVACRYAGWLPVLRPRLGPGEVWRAPALRHAAPAVAVVLGTDGAVEGLRCLELELPVPDEVQRRDLWATELGEASLAKEVAATALLSGPAIVTAAVNARITAQRLREPLGVAHIAMARRQLGAHRLRLLAQPVMREVTRESMVLPTRLIEDLDDVVLRSRRRESLWTGLGATMQATRNSGVRALFVGESGTGKTLAASYVATALGAPLYRVDLASVMNKYIGESEKNLGTLLDEAAAADVVLLFDEADSLFGRRTDGKETGERYANMLTNFLLTRIENHPGIVILTTNSRERIDGAFTRRIDVIAEFPLPGFEERLGLWRSHLGERGPGEEVYRHLASYCELSGGQVRNVVVSAAARNDAGTIGTSELVHGLEREYRKLGKSLPAKLAQMNGDRLS